MHGPPRLLVMALVVSVAACGSPSTTSDSTGPATAPTTTLDTTLDTSPGTTPDTTVDTTPPTESPTTTSVTPLDPRLVVEPIEGITTNCSESGCTSLVISQAGELVVLDPTISELRFLESGRTVAVDPSLGVWMFVVAVGPDDVAYLGGTPPDANDPVAILVAVATTGPSAGQEIARAPGNLDGSGDSTLIATASGLMEVGCCGFGERLPPAGSEVELAWVTPDGEPSGVMIPEVFLEYPASRTDTVVVRNENGVEQRWTVPAMLGGRDMPPVAATADGGALVWMYDGMGSPDTPAVLYDLRPDGSIDTYALGDLQYVAAMHASRVVVAYAGDSFVRITLPS